MKRFYIYTKNDQECLYCGGFVYLLADKRVKCSACNKKISINKIDKIIALIEAFIDNESVLHVTQRLSLSYASVQKYYKEFRLISAYISENEYEKLRANSCEYEEYFYLPKAKKREKEAIFDAHNFLTFDYTNHIYTLLMPSLHQYKKQFIEDSIENIYIDEFNKFKRDNRIIKVSKRYNNIVKFWSYFETQILRYKGVSNDSFAYYLKEFEFKYNHTKDESIALLIQNYFRD